MRENNEGFYADRNMYSGNGELVADFSSEKRIFVPYSSIPQNVINAHITYRIDFPANIQRLTLKK